MTECAEFDNLKAKLKQWEREWAQRTGAKPSKAEIKADPAVCAPRTVPSSFLRESIE